MNTAEHTWSPADALPLLPLIQGVIFPHTTTTIPVGRARSAQLAQELRPGQLVLVAIQREASMQDPTLLHQLHPIATLARVQQIVKLAQGNFRLAIEGLARVRLTALTAHEPYWLATAQPVAQELGDEDEVQARADALKERLGQVISQSGGALERSLRQIEDPGQLADRVAAELGLDTPWRVQILAELEVNARLKLVIEAMSQLLTRAEIKAKIEEEVRQTFGKNQREAILREQLRAIRKELGDDPQEEGDKLRQRLDEAQLPDEVRQVAEREYARLQALNPAQAEHNVIRTYLEWILELPWQQRVPSTLDIEAIAGELERGHFGLEDAKRHILEHMAVLKLSGGSRGTILCLAGPPGVGKTSLAQSVADAIGRPLVRISLGGVRDEAEIRGHRRTYVGAMPGRLISALRKAKVNNPVIVLDEIDKLAQGWMGSPEAALLEVLDPEQNATFTDHYMELPFDLSGAMFICTANDLQGISAPLRDRLEIIEVSGYTPHEKTQIAQHHLWPSVLKEHGLAPEQVTLSREAIEAIITEHTREAGVRQLKRQLTKIARGVTLEIARQPSPELAVVPLERGDLDRHLGRARFVSEVALRVASPGVATGLAWTPMGGDILFIESTRMPGKGRVETTGQLGDVMKESARAALAYVRAHAQQLGVSPDFLEAQDIHIHIPAGGVPKDGPSAGVTLFTALTSLLTGRPVRPDTAMTGECSLRGQVLPVGGIKAKVLAAHRAGIRRVILPERNARDLEDVPAGVLQELEIILAHDMEQVLSAALVSPHEGVGQAAGQGAGVEVGPLSEPAGVVEPGQPLSPHHARGR